MSLQDKTSPSEFARTGFEIYKAPMALSKLQRYFSIVNLPSINIFNKQVNPIEEFPKWVIR